MNKYRLKYITKFNQSSQIYKNLNNKKIKYHFLMIWYKLLNLIMNNYSTMKK